MNYTSKAVYQYISEKTNDPIVEWKVCSVSGQEFAVYQSDLDFYAMMSPTFNGETFTIPTPILCREERQRRRLSRRNLNKLYRRKCAASNKDIISIYNNESPFVVFDQKIRWSDQYDPLAYGKEFDFTKTFTEQFRELQLSVPRCSLLNGMNDNSDYANHSYYNKNCYLAFASGFNEDCMFTDWVIESQDVVDSWNIQKGNNCYECIACKRVTGCINTSYSEDCSSCRYCFDCKNCSYCIGCIGLNNTSYHVFNQKVTKEQYDTMVAALDSDPAYRKIIEQKYAEFSGSFPHSSRKSFASDNSFCIESSYMKDAKFIIQGREVENVSYGSELLMAKDCRDFDVWGIADKILEVHCAGGSLDTESGAYMHNVMFSNVIWHGDGILYSDNCLGEASNCFGCVGLKNNSYCIFNKQYTKEAYEKQVAKIITHMKETGERGHYFDNSLCPFGYNETMAMLHTPLTEKEASEKGFTWAEEKNDVAVPENSAAIYPKEYSDKKWKELLNDTGIVNKIIICETSGKPFRVVKKEIEFYKKHLLDIPKKHPDVRHEERLKRRPGRSLYLRKCDKTGEEILSVYPQETSFPVYSEEAYTKEFYS